MSEPITIVIADDHPIFRRGLVAAIKDDPQMRVVGEASDGKEALSLVESLMPDVVVLDIDMPLLDGIDVARALRDRKSSCRKIFLTMHKDNSILRSLRSLDVKAYVLKDSAVEEIIKCIRTVKDGGIYLSPALNEILLENVSDVSDSKISASIRNLTPSEKNVLIRIAGSKTNREIADELFVAVRTIETHRYNICAKLGLSGPNALLKFAIHNREELLLRLSK